MTREEIKQQYSMRDIVERYGFKPNRAGFISCPFHSGDRRERFGLNMTSADDLRKMGDMNPITVNYNGVSYETARAFDNTIQELSEEYLTGFTKIEVGDKKQFFGANNFATTQHNNAVGQKTLILNPHKTSDYNKMTERIRELSDKGYAVKISEGLEGQYIATHEFAHSLIDLSVTGKHTEFAL